MTRILDDGADYIQLPLDASGKLSAFVKTTIGTVGAELYLPTAVIIDDHGNTMDSLFYRGILGQAVSDEETHDKLFNIMLLLTEIATALNFIVADTRGGRQETEVTSDGQTTYSEHFLYDNA